MKQLCHCSPKLFAPFKPSSEIVARVVDELIGGMITSTLDDVVVLTSRGHPSLLFIDFDLCMEWCNCENCSL